MYFLFKRALDMFFSAIGLIVLFPLLAIFAIAIKIDSNGPVIFKQKRLGRNGTEFDMYKFRTMVVNAESKGTGLFNYDNDPRVTRVGRFLRETSIDELPQLINVIKGEMSLVGPRPPVKNELGDYNLLNARYKKRFEVLPGITGLAQVSGRNELPWDEKINYDNQYVEMVKKNGLFVDIKILLLTIINVFRKKDIYEKKVSSDINDEESAKIAALEVISKAQEKESGSDL